MKKYNYLENMEKDIYNSIIENDYFADIDEDERDFDTIAEKMRDDFWDADEITGNGSGSYTFSRSVAKEYVLENIDLIEELCDEGLATVEMVGEKFISEDWEWMDVCIRCYLLSYAISNVLNSHADEWNIKD